MDNLSVKLNENETKIVEKFYNIAKDIANEVIVVYPNDSSIIKRLTFQLDAAKSKYAFLCGINVALSINENYDVSSMKLSTAFDNVITFLSHKIK